MGQSAYILSLTDYEKVKYIGTLKADESFSTKFVQILGNSLVVQGLGLGAFAARAQVQSLVGVLRSCKACGQKKKLMQKLLVFLGLKAAPTPTTPATRMFSTSRCGGASFLREFISGFQEDQERLERLFGI